MNVSLRDKIQTWRLLASIILDNLSGPLMKSIVTVITCLFISRPKVLRLTRTWVILALGRLGVTKDGGEVWRRARLFWRGATLCCFPQRRAATGAEGLPCTRCCSVRVAQFRCRGSAQAHGCIPASSVVGAGFWLILRVVGVPREHLVGQICCQPQQPRIKRVETHLGEKKKKTEWMETLRGWRKIIWVAWIGENANNVGGRGCPSPSP